MAVQNGMKELEWLDPYYLESSDGETVRADSKRYQRQIAHVAKFARKAQRALDEVDPEPAKILLSKARIAEK